MKQTLFLISLLLLISCNTSSGDQIQLLNGYWNIEQVLLPDGTERDFPFTNHMDYFETTANEGYKHRVSPDMMGGFISYGDPVRFTWMEGVNGLELLYSKGEGAYKQELVKCTDKELTLKHENGILYVYSRYEHEEK